MNPKKSKSVNDINSIEELAALRHSINVNQAHTEELSLGDRIADGMADVAGSWGFILSFLAILFVWIVLNSIQLLMHSFDPFPFILLNLVLSCVAAIQAPVIMMSQNRQEKKDRIRSEQDYHINLKAEILIEDIISRLKRLEENHTELGKNQQEILKGIKELKN